MATTATSINNNTHLATPTENGGGTAGIGSLSCCTKCLARMKSPNFKAHQFPKRCQRGHNNPLTARKNRRHQQGNDEHEQPSNQGPKRLQLLGTKPSQHGRDCPYLQKINISGSQIEGSLSS